MRARASTRLALAVPLAVGLALACGARAQVAGADAISEARVRETVTWLAADDRRDRKSVV